MANVKAFNALPREPRAPSGLVPYHWHFDLRYIPLDPPCHILFLIQLDSSYIYSERLPLGLPTGTSGITFFPESGVAAAPEICKALIHAFLDNFGNTKYDPNTPPPRAPWKLTTEDPTLAAAVGDEFKRLGVRAPELWKIHSVSGRSLLKAQKAFDDFWETLKEGMGMRGIAAAALSAPQSITFNRFSQAKWVEDEDRDNTQKMLDYARQLSAATPLKPYPASSRDDISEALTTVMDLLNEKTTKVVRAEAESGNPESAIDYAIRLQYGINCTPSRDLFRFFMVKAITNRDATPLIKAKAHALLIEWYTRASSNGQIRYRYIHAAAYHANEATNLVSGAALPAVLWFVSRTLEPLSYKLPEVLVQYKAVWAVLERRNKEVNKETAQAEKKRAKRSNRYICATVTCLIQADTGKMLSQCAGKCDADKKPSYCSKECQRSDWKTHKPFCKPGAPCSILEKDEELPVAGGTTEEGSLSVPIIGPDGETILLSSSTMSVDMLKEIRQYSEERASGVTSITL